MKALLYAGALLAPVAVVAADDTATSLDPVVVTATGQQVRLTETLAPLLVLDREQIEQAQAADLAELLRFFAGLELGRNGGPGATTSLFVRGGESNHTLVLIDGVRVNPGTSGGAALQNIAPEMIERIEVVKGPRASLYGSDAIAAVVNVITRRARGLSADASLRAGSDDTRDASLRGSIAGGRGSLGLQAQHLGSGGFPAHVELDENTGYRRTSLNADGTLRLGKAELGARLWDTHGEAEYYAFTPEPAEQDYRNRIAALDLSLPLGGALSAGLRASRMQDEIDQRGSDDFVETVRSELDAALSGARGAHRLSGGISAIREEVDAFASFTGAIAQVRDILSLRLQDELRSGRHRAVLGGSWSDHEGFGDRVDGNLDYGFDLGTGTRLVASVGTGFRAPDATDRFGFGGNPDLQPEQARNYELGLQQGIGSTQRLDLRLFRSDVEDLISLVCDENFNCTAVNVDEYRNQGVELTYRLEWDAWSATLTGLAQDPVDRSTGTQLLRRARRSAALRLGRSFGPHAVALDVLGSDSRPDFGTELGGYALVNATARLRLNRRADLRLRVENLLDQRYQTAAGYNQQELAAFATLALRY